MRKRKLLWGLAFLLAAALLVAGNFTELPVSDILIMLAMMIFFIEGIIRRNFALVLFPLAVVLIVNSERLGMSQISPWSILAAALLGSIGLGVLFPHRHKHWTNRKSFFGNYSGTGRRDSAQSGKQEETVQDGSGREVYLRNAFGDTAKYFTGEMPEHAYLENQFGSMSVYFDNVVMKEHTASVHVKSYYGKMVLYIPAVWKVIIRGDVAFGAIREQGQCNPDGVDILELKAEAPFGDIEIRYI